MTEQTSMVPVQDEPAGRDRKPVLVAGGLVAALALSAGGYFLLAGGSSSEDTFVVPSAQRKAPAAAKPAVKKATTATKPGVTALPARTTVQLGRDPFKPLYVEPAAPAVAPPVVPPVGTTPTGTTPPVSGGATTPTTYPMVLKRVYGSGAERTAEFSVDGKTMLAKVGSVFGKTSELKLLSLSQNSKGTWLGTVQVGDSDPFDAVQGQKVYVA